MIRIIRTVAILYYFLLTGNRSSAQMPESALNASFAGPYAYSGSQADLQAAGTNPGALSGRGLVIRGGNSYGLKELRELSLTGAWQAGHFQTCILAAVRGFALYQETGFSAMVARKLGEHIDLGLSFSYQMVRQSGYKPFRSPGAAMGIRIHPFPGLTVGFAAANPLHGSLPPVYRFGIGYDASDSFFAGIEIKKEAEWPAQVMAAVVYKVKPLIFRTGLNSATNAFFAGAGYVLHKWRLMVMLSHHPQLGFSQGLSLQYCPAGKNK